MPLYNSQYFNHQDNWAVGCIFYELVTLEPLFYCRQDDVKNNMAYNVDQLDKIFSVLGYPNGNFYNIFAFTNLLQTMQ